MLYDVGPLPQYKEGERKEINVHVKSFIKNEKTSSVRVTAIFPILTP
jgi:hypothetical protein